MSSLSSWMPGLVAFLAFFASASLVSGVVYGMARVSALRGLNFLFLITALGAMLFNLWIVLVPLLIIVAFSALQAFIENLIVGQDVMGKRHFVRAFLCYVCSIFYGYVLVVQVINLLKSARLLSSHDLSVGSGGFVAGLVLAPVSISFFRWMLQNVALRPGVDRALREDEVGG